MRGKYVKLEVRRACGKSADEPTVFGAKRYIFRSIPVKVLFWKMMTVLPR